MGTEIKNKSDLSEGNYKKDFIGKDGKNKIAYFKASGPFLSVKSLEEINDLIGLAIEGLIPKLEFDGMYFFEIDIPWSHFKQLEEKPSWFNKK